MCNLILKLTISNFVTVKNLFINTTTFITLSPKLSLSKETLSLSHSQTMEYSKKVLDDLASLANLKKLKVQ